MSTKATAVTAAFVAREAERRARPPVAIAGAGARGWIVVEHGPSSCGGDALVLDEYGDLW